MYLIQFTTFLIISIQGSIIFFVRKLPVFFSFSVFCALCAMLIIYFCIENIEIRTRDSDFGENKMQSEKHISNMICIREMNKDNGGKEVIDYFNAVKESYNKLEKEMGNEKPDKFILESLLVELEQNTSHMLYRVATKMEWNVRKEDSGDSKLQD